MRRKRRGGAAAAAGAGAASTAVAFAVAPSEPGAAAATRVSRRHPPAATIAHARTTGSAALRFTSRLAGRQDLDLGRLLLALGRWLRGLAAGALQLHVELQRLGAAPRARPVRAADHAFVRLVPVLLDGDRVRRVRRDVLAGERRVPARDPVDHDLGARRAGGDLQKGDDGRRRGRLLAFGRLRSLGGLGSLGRLLRLFALGGLRSLGRLGRFRLRAVGGGFRFIAGGALLARSRRRLLARGGRFVTRGALSPALRLTFVWTGRGLLGRLRRLAGFLGVDGWLFRLGAT